MSDPLIFHDIFSPPFSLHGLSPNQPGVLCRLPEALLPECGETVRELAFNTSGGRVRFATDTDTLAVEAELRDTKILRNMAPSGVMGMTLCREEGGKGVYVKNLLPKLRPDCLQMAPRYHESATLPGGLHTYSLFLPLYAGFLSLRIGLPQGAKLLPPRAYSGGRVVFYGSSITQGGCASGAGLSYPNLLCRKLDIDITNLGFSGSAKGEPFMARHIASLPMEAFVMDYDHNAPTAEHLLATHEPFFRVIREARPSLPVIFITRPNVDVDPMEASVRREIIRTTYENARERGDKAVWFIDGASLFGADDRDFCLVDDAHPTDIGFARMAEAILPVLREALVCVNRP